MSRLSACVKILLLSALLALGAIPFGGSALATEGGGSAYPNGAEDFMAGALPPPGTYFINYFNYYRATTFKDKDGNSAMPKFDLNAYVDVLRFVHVTPYKLFGANWAVHTLIPLVYTDVDATSGKDNRSGLGDIIIDPFILGWHFKNFHVTTGLDIFLPTGSYDKNRLSNTSRNYWTFEPVLGLTYLADNGFEVSGKFMYDFNTRNNDTEYTSGQEFHVDYSVGYHLSKTWVLGVGGYYYQQTSNDEQNGIKVGTDGFKGRVIAAGPQACYNFKNMSLTLKWQKEFEAENRPEGDNFWLKFVYFF